jgi:hypothetical protein
VLKLLDSHDRPARSPAPERRDGILFDEAAERACLDRADLVLAATETEAEAIGALTRAPVLVLGIRPPATVRIARRPRRGPLRCTFLGARTPGNRRAVQALAEAVAARPGLRGRIEVAVAGSAAECLDAPTLARAGPALRVAAPVDDLAAVYGATDVVIAPDLADQGVRISTIEALGTGLPVIATRAAMAGLGARHPAHGCADVAALLDRAEALAEGQDSIDELARAGQQLLAEYRVAYAAALGELVAGLERPRLVLDPGEPGLATAIWLVAAAPAFGRLFDLAWLGPPQSLSGRLAKAVALRAGSLRAAAAPGPADLVWTTDPAVARRAGAAICPVPKSLAALRRTARVAAAGVPAHFLIRSVEQRRLLEGLVEGVAMSLAHPIETALPDETGGPPATLLLLDGLPAAAAVGWFLRFDAALDARGVRPDLVLVHETPDVFAVEDGIRVVDPLGCVLRPPPGRLILTDPGRPGAEEWDLRAWLYSRLGSVLALDTRMKAQFAAEVTQGGARTIRFTTPEDAAAAVARQVAAPWPDAWPEPALTPGGVLPLLAALRRSRLPGTRRTPGRVAA